MNEYQIFEKNGKYGLAYGSNILLNPAYSSLIITNNNPPEHTLKDYEDDQSVYEVWEKNYPIVIAEHKQGLAYFNRMMLDVKYERIYKLTYDHYLCREQTKWILYDFSHAQLYNSTMITISPDLTLEKLLQILAQDAPDFHKGLLKKLHQDSRTDRYISDYRVYYGEQYLGSAMFHDFEAAVTRMFINNDFSPTPYIYEQM
jgi:hypothetical protein